MESSSPEARYQLWLAWQNSLFNAYFEAQESLGRSRQQALNQLREVWAREDEERLQAYRRAAELSARAG